VKIRVIRKNVHISDIGIVKVQQEGYILKILHPVLVLRNVY